MLGQHKKVWLTWAVSLFLSSCGGNNGDSIPADGVINEGESCANRPNDCKAGLLCLDQICRRVCSKDQDCDTRTQHCSDSVCITGSSIQCGNGIVEAGENCDDGNAKDNDGCSASCQKESGWNCVTGGDDVTTCVPICGDGIRVGAELDSNGCDDGNNDNIDECPSGVGGTCTKARCGDGFIYRKGGDIKQNCTAEELAAGANCAEECDDGNNVDGDGCNANCRIEHGWSCTGAEDNSRDSACQCLANFTGNGCGDCNSDYFGENCLPCPGKDDDVLPGTCNNHGKCAWGRDKDGVCECDAGFTGDSCTDCMPHHEGEDCHCSVGWAKDEAGICTRCAFGYWGEQCENTCPGFAEGNICGGHGRCNDGLDGDGSCECNITAQTEGWDNNTDSLCTICKDGWTDDADGGSCNSCADGYYGPLCDQICPGGAGELQCNGNGKCADGFDGDGSCECQAPFKFDKNTKTCTECVENHYGDNCTPCLGTKEGTLACFGHGTCNDGAYNDGTCSCIGNFDPATGCRDCIDGYFNSTCSQKCPTCTAGVCDDGIAGTGQCSGCSGNYIGEKCDKCKVGWDLSSGCTECADGYYGPKCTPCPGGAGADQCFGHGQCNDGINGDGSCSCNNGWDATYSCNDCADGYYGQNCQVCPGGAGADQCFGHGRCSDGKAGDGSCSCDAHWLGNNTCSACTDGWAGLQCDKECKGGANNQCNGHGTCLQGTKGDGSCNCQANWQGNDSCSQCTVGYFNSSCSAQCPGGANNACYGHGTCDDGVTGSGSCRQCSGNWDKSQNCNECLDGYGGNDCQLVCPGGATNQCNGHGTCADGKGNNATCSCLANWQGNSGCSECTAGYWGQDCTACPANNGKICAGHGSCSDKVNGDGSCSCDGNWDSAQNCSECKNGFAGLDCSAECPGGANNQCNGHGVCSWGAANAGTCSCYSDSNHGFWMRDGVGNCTMCKNHYDINSGCKVCPAGFSGSDCEIVDGISPVTLVNAVKPITNACNSAVTGWTDSSGKYQTIKFTHDKLGKAGYTFECRTGPRNSISSISWSATTVENGVGICTFKYYGAQPNGDYATQIRVYATANIAGAAMTTVQYYMSESLNNASCCSTTAVSDNAYFTAAMSVLSHDKSFNKAASDLSLPYATIAGLEGGGVTAHPVTLRKQFAFNNDSTLLLLRRHTSSGYAQRHGEAGHCKINTWLGYLSEPVGKDVSSCVTRRRGKYFWKVGRWDSYWREWRASVNGCEFVAQGNNYCRKYTYSFYSITPRDVVGEISKSYSISKISNECVSKAYYETMLYRHHYSRTKYSCDALVFNSYGDIACLAASNGTVTVQKTLISNHNFDSNNNYSGFSGNPKWNAHSIGYRLLGYRERLYGLFSQKNDNCLNYGGNIYDNFCLDNNFIFMQ